jgi:hypothetical protein
MTGNTRYQQDLYQRDRAAWLQNQVRALRSGRFAQLDHGHLVEELEAEVGNYKREIKRRLRVLLAHLLKWKYQPDQRSSSWRGTIRVQRIDIADVLDDNPSLRPGVQQAIRDAYPQAAKLAADETGQLEDLYPRSCEWTEQEILDTEFWPE